MPPNPVLEKSISILSLHPRLGLPSGLHPSDFHIKTLYVPFPIRATCPAHLIRLYLINRQMFGQEYRS